MEGIEKKAFQKDGEKKITGWRVFISQIMAGFPRFGIVDRQLQFTLFSI